MKSYGFKVSDGKVTFTRWFSNNGTTDGIATGKLHDIISGQHYRVYHQAYAYAKSAALKYNLKFETLTEEDWKQLGNPIKVFFNKLISKIKGGK